MLSFIFGILVFGIPYLVQKYIHKVPFSNLLSPIVICYAIGILWSIVNKEEQNSYFKVASLISQASILIAIPMLLYGSSSVKMLSG
jgi:putative effector of murein hydrolase